MRSDGGTAYPYGVEPSGESERGSAGPDLVPRPHRVPPVEDWSPYLKCSQVCGAAAGTPCLSRSSRVDGGRPDGASVELDRAHISRRRRAGAGGTVTEYEYLAGYPDCSPDCEADEQGVVTHSATHRAAAPCTNGPCAPPAWGCGYPDCAGPTAAHHKGSYGVRPWCGAPRELGGQQPCPIIEPCPAGTCGIAGTRDYGVRPPGMLQDDEETG